MDKTRSRRVRLIGFTAMGFCAIGYAGFALALLAGKLGYMDMTQAIVLSAVLAVIGEVGLWVGAGCLGLTLFRKRKAMFDRLFRRNAAPSGV